jgi:hypothetical protein
MFMRVRVFFGLSFRNAAQFENGAAKKVRLPARPSRAAIPRSTASTSLPHVRKHRLRHARVRDRFPTSLSSQIRSLSSGARRVGALGVIPRLPHRAQPTLVRKNCNETKAHASRPPSTCTPHTPDPTLPSLAPLRPMRSPPAMTAVRSCSLPVPSRSCPSPNTCRKSSPSSPSIPASALRFPRRRVHPTGHRIAHVIVSTANMINRTSSTLRRHSTTPLEVSPSAIRRHNCRRSPGRRLICHAGKDRTRTPCRARRTHIGLVSPRFTSIDSKRWIGTLRTRDRARREE